MFVFCVVYDSRGGTTRHAAEHVAKLLGVPSFDVKHKETIDALYHYEAFIFFTYTDMLGKLSKRTRRFLFDSPHAKRMKGVVANGSSDFIPKGVFGVAGDIISNQYQVPLIRKLDKGGTERDLREIQEKVAVMFGIESSSNQFALNTGRLNGMLQLKRA